jgi:hypothetical protein
MAAIGHHEKRRPRTREMPPPQLVAFKNPPQPVEEDPVEELISKVSQVNLEDEEDEEYEDIDDDISDISDDFSSEGKRRKPKSKGHYNDADAPKAEIVTPDYGTPEEIQLAVTRIRRKKVKNGSR